MTRSTPLARCERAASAAEFALVLPLLLILLLGIIDGGRFLFEVNQAQKATQVGARMLAVTSPLAAGLSEADYAGFAKDDGTKLASGDTIPLEALGTILCTSEECTCETTPCPDLGEFASTQFTNVLLARMQQINPRIEADNIEVRYSGAGIGSAGDLIVSGPTKGGSPPPEQMEVAPMITVSLTGMQFRPVTLLALATVDLPSFATSMTAEDTSGTVSN